MAVRALMSRITGLPGRAPALVWAGLLIVLGGITTGFAFTSVLWTGTSVRGVERGGIVYYTFHGQNYSIDDTSRFNSPTVYFDPHDPSGTAQLDNIAFRLVSVGLAALPLLIALVIIGFDIRRRRIIRRQTKAPGERAFGDGLDVDLVHRLNVERRQHS